MPETNPPTDVDTTWLVQSLELEDPRQLPTLEVRTYASGEVIVKEGETGDDIFVLYEGKLSVRQGTKMFGLLPREVGRLKPGTIFGEVGFFVQAPRSATVVAKGKARVFRIGAKDMRRILSDNPRLAQSLSALAKSRLQSL